MFFTGYTNREAEGHLVSAITGEEMDSGDWEIGEPNNWGTGKECVIYNSGTGLINDFSELA